MHPILFTFGSVHGYSYGLMIGLGAILAIFLSEWRAKRRGLDGDLVFSSALWGLFAGLLGAKLTFVLSHIKLIPVDPGYVFGTEGFTVYGGIILGVLTGVLILRRKKVNVPIYLDVIVPQIALAQGFGRIGCFLAGCCYGKPTDHVIGVVFPPEAIAPSGIKLLPTQLFSSAGDFLIFAILLLLSHFATDYLPVRQEEGIRKSKSSFLQPLSICGFYLLLYGIGRFIIEFFRDDPRRSLLGLTSNQYVSVLFFLGGVFLILLAMKRGKRQKSVPNSGLVAN